MELFTSNICIKLTLFVYDYKIIKIVTYAKLVFTVKNSLILLILHFAHMQNQSYVGK